MKKSQSGFTLIELVVVIVLLGILGVTALGKFQDLSGSAQNAANGAIAAEITAAAAINYAASVLPGAVAGTDYEDITATNCTGGGADPANADIDALFSTGTAPAAYTYAIGGGGTEGTDCNAGDTYICNVSNGGTVGVATVICTS